jgi:hypothetical protein
VTYIHMHIMTMIRWFLYTLCVAALRTGNAIHETVSAGQALREMQTLGVVDRFVLINADTKAPIVDLFNGTVINIATQSTSNFNIQVTLVANSGNVGSILFGYNTNPSYRIETGAPYAFCGDGKPAGNYYTCKNLNTANGQPHIVSATPYAGTKASGTMGVTKTISFQIVNIPPNPVPFMSPTKIPSSAPTKTPSSAPTKAPSSAPTKAPSSAPTKTPTLEPSSKPLSNPLPLPICNIPQVSIAEVKRSFMLHSTLAHIFKLRRTSFCIMWQFIDATWTGISPNYPNGTVEAMGLLIGNDYVSFGGFVDAFTATTNQTYARDITVANSPWRLMDDIPLAIAFTHAPTVRIGTKVYMCGGYLGAHPGPHTASCFIYDHSIPPGNGLQWTRFADLPNNGYAGGGMIYDTIRDTLYFAGGGQRLKAGSIHPVDSDRAFKYSLQNPTAGWAEIAPIPYKANHLSSVTQTYLGKEYHYFMGGQKGEFEVTQNLADLYEFIASNETWARRTFMPFGRSHATASTRPFGCGFIIAGGSLNSITTKKNRTTDIIYYDIPSDIWTGIGNLSVRVPHATPLVDIHANGYMYYINNKGSNRRQIAV